MPSFHGKNGAEDFPVRGWLAQSSPDFRSEFLALGRRKLYSAGTVFYRAGDAGHDLFGIRSGVVVVQRSFTNPDAVLVHMLRSGHWFGTADWLFDRTRRMATVARTDVEVLRVSGEDLEALLRRRPEGIGMLARNAMWALDIAMQCAADLLIQDSKARCAATLLRLAERRSALGAEADQPSEIPASQAELAMLCNVSRKTFSRVISEFSGERLVTANYRSLTVTDPARLRIVADSD